MTTVTYTVRYRRPEAPWSLAKMTVSADFEGINVQIGRLLALGYTVVEVSPPPERAAEPAPVIVSLAS